ncbi:MAG: oligosaccharide flippase family protein [Cytophagaceae bacterium]
MLLIIILNIAIKPIWLIMENMVQNEIGHEQFGLYAALFSFGLMFLVLSDVGINQYLTKELASKPNFLKSVLPSVFGFKLLVSFVYPNFMVFAGYLLGYRGEELVYLFIICIIQAILQIILFYRAKFQASQDFKLDSLASVFDKTILIGITFFLLSVKIDLDGFIMARGISSAVAFFVLGFIIIRKYGWFGLSFKKPDLNIILRGSFPFALIALVFSVHERVDQVMLERLADDKTAGLYAASYRWVDACMMYLWTILPLFFARFSFLHREPEEQQKIFNMGMIISNVPIMFICGFVFFYGDQLFWLFSNSTSEEIGIMSSGVKILFLAVFFHGFFAIAGTYLSSCGYVNFINKMMVVSIIINIVLNVILIDSLGSLAAAISTVVSTAYLSIAYVVYIRWHTPLKISGKIVGMLFFNAMIFMGVLYVLNMFIETWYVNMIIGLIVLVGMSFLTGLLKLSGILDKNKSIVKTPVEA